ncbi:peptide chain release factor 3 [Mobilicoccus pelagius]|uniref:peptide chain release factor 3 n=1 Tax=Mobilicoccus pelagius TaxID=746032 RepID=UPI00068A7AD6|nr:peptide chain release factor 3 [Mobilicoccus pelagius]
MTTNDSTTSTGGAGRPARVLEEASRRRTFAIISHPDAGKSTTTEALALHAAAIGRAGAVHGKGDRKGVTSDWLDMEKERGISITSSALQFRVGDVRINMLDTPGHADFSEDTYRVLSAVDCAVMLIDAAKGLEPQTLKLFEVCRARRIPIITFVNKWDRPALEPLAILDEIDTRLGLATVPVTWPVGPGGEFHGVVDRRTGRMIEYARAAGGATLAQEHDLSPEGALDRFGEDWVRAEEEHELVEPWDEDAHEAFLRGETSPVLFGAAVANMGVGALLDLLVEAAPSPAPWPLADGGERPLDAPFSGFVFKVQAGMDAAHRDRLAFVRVCSGRFERGMPLVHAASGRSFVSKYAQSVFGRDRRTVDEAFPGDIVGLVNAAALRVGDTLYDGPPALFPPVPRFSPEHFSIARVADAGRSKQFRKGIAQLDEEGVVQVCVSDRRGTASPVLAAVGPMQFEVVSDRMAHEFNAPIRLEPLPYSIARRPEPEIVDTINRTMGAEVLHRTDGTPVAVFRDQWRLSTVQGDLPAGSLKPLFGEESLAG